MRFVGLESILVDDKVGSINLKVNLALVTEYLLLLRILLRILELHAFLAK